MDGPSARERETREINEGHENFKVFRVFCTRKSKEEAGLTDGHLLLHPSSFILFLRRFGGAMMRLLAVTLSFLIYLSVAHIASSRLVEAKDTWLRIESKNFILIGNASEKDLRKVGLRLEQFREAISRFFIQPKQHPSIPITVIVFKDDLAYQPFKPLYQSKPLNVSGYFQSTDGISYITLTADWRSLNPYSVIFHEYVHYLTSNGSRRLPAWISEGIAEYYSTFEIAKGEKKIVIGKAIANHIRLLRERRLIPLPDLLAADQASLLYNDSATKNIFYAQSWALVHYLLLGNGERRQTQFFQFIDLLRRGRPAGESFKEAFQTDETAIDQELAGYIQRGFFPSEERKFEQKIEFDPTMESTIVTEAEVESCLGDLLWRIHRPEEAEIFLGRALSLDPNLATAHTSLGLLRIRQNRYSEARKHFEKAVAIDWQNYLTHYYHAYSLHWEQVDETRYVSHFTEESVKKMRASLNKARELAPDFPDTYKQLAFINLILNENLDEAVDHLKLALSLAPHREDFAYTLAQVYLRQKNFAAARRTIEPVAAGVVKTEVRDRAKSLLEAIANAEEQAARLAQANQSQSSAKNASTSSPPLPGKRFEGEQARGMLTNIDCTDTSITLTVKSGARVFKFHKPKFGDLIFVRYTIEIPTTITCSAINPARPVIVTYRKPANAGSKFDGEPVGVEFIK
jgi:tetratricopeptide (TPR) repeat protein